MSKPTAINAPQFTDETAAIGHLEASRWPGGVNCPHCGSVDRYAHGRQNAGRMFLCNDCREKFTARSGTVMERSHIPVHKWLLAIHLLNSGKNGVSADELHRLLGITYKSAWFLSHRIREAMRDASPTPMGGEGNQYRRTRPTTATRPSARRAIARATATRQRCLRLLNLKAALVRSTRTAPKARPCAICLLPI